MTHEIINGRARNGRFRPVVTAGLSVICALASCFPCGLEAQQQGVSQTLHNLSVSGPGDIKSMTETEVCKFCHIPHNPVVPQPLWGHALSQVAQYEVAKLGRGTSRERPSSQPDGSSRLCLSCHDGTVALGEVAGEPQTIPMSGAVRLSQRHRGYLGTNLSGGHPISFVYEEDSAADSAAGRDMGLKPRSVIATDQDVHLDAGGKMQCTTCHDPHSDRYFRADEVPHFWVKPTLEGVCLTCHELR